MADPKYADLPGIVSVVCSIVLQELVRATLYRPTMNLMSTKQMTCQSQIRPPTSTKTRATPLNESISQLMRLLTGLFLCLEPL